MNRNVFNEKGDFITSPEISQLFGEMIGVWIKSFWESNCSDQALFTKSIVELGPGTGKLMKCIISTLSQFESLSNVKIQFVEVSPFLTKLQQTSLSETFSDHEIFLTYEENEDVQILKDDSSNVCLIWHKSFSSFVNYHSDQNLPMNTVILGHEFLDALPGHKFIFKEGQWVEKLIDLNSYTPSKQIIVSATNHETVEENQKSFKIKYSDPRCESVNIILKPEQRFSQITIQEGQEIEISPISRINSQLLL